MTLKDKATIQRAIGMVEGIAASEDEAKANMLRDAIRMIEGVIDRNGQERSP